MTNQAPITNEQWLGAYFVIRSFEIDSSFIIYHSSFSFLGKIICMVLAAREMRICLVAQNASLKFGGEASLPWLCFKYLRQRGVAWTYYRDAPSLKLLEDQPEHGCDLCSRYRLRAVYQIARELSANVIALGHTADDFCESLLRNTMFTGRLSALPPVTWSRERDFRLIRPLVFVTEDVTRAYAESLGVPLIPCGCSQRTGTVRRSLRDLFASLEKEYPHLKENILSAMGNIDTGRLLDTRFLKLDAAGEETEDAAPFPIVTEP